MKCNQCGAPLDGPSRVRCLKCLAYQRAYMRKRNGGQAWKRGGRGRPPLQREESR
jgi:hypothetical protein